MTWPLRVQEIVNLLAAGVPHDAPDERRRATTRQIAQQCRFELGSNWGTKRADPGRPLSADVVCTQSPFVGWDWSVPGGIAQFPERIDLTGQTFVAVVPVNHLGTRSPAPDPSPPAPAPPPAPPPVDLGPILSRLDRIDAALLALVGKPAPPYEGSAAIRYLGTAPITLRPTSPSSPEEPS